MADNMDDLFASVKKMVDSGNIPKDIQQMMNNIQNSSNNNSTSNNINNTSNNNNDLNNILSQFSPETLNNLSSMLQSNNQNSNSSNPNNSSGFNIDMNTMMKMKNIISSMKQKNDPRANLLYSLKPYLRDSKKDKLDQYVNLLNMTKIADVMRNDNKENNKNA